MTDIATVKYRDFILKIHYKAIRHIYLKVKADGFIHISCSFRTQQESLFRLVDSHYERLQQLFKRIPIVNDRFPVLTAEEELQASNIFQSRLAYWFNLHFLAMGFVKPALVLRYMTSRWGSYSRKTHRICLNYSLFKYSPAAIDYVIVHELCHMVYFNHGKDFYGLVRQILPDWKNSAREFKN